MRWLPEYGVGLIAMSNQTYQGFGGLFNDTAIRFNCDNGPIAARIALDPNTHKLTSLDLVPLREQRCVP